MAGRRSDQQQDKYDSLVLDTIKGVDKKVDRHEDQLDDHERKINKLWSAVFSTTTAKSVKDLPPLWRDPNIIKLLTYVVLATIIIASIYAGLKGIPVRLP